MHRAGLTVVRDDAPDATLCVVMFVVMFVCRLIVVRFLFTSALTHLGACTASSLVLRCFSNFLSCWSGATQAHTTSPPFKPNLPVSKLPVQFSSYLITLSTLSFVHLHCNAKLNEVESMEGNHFVQLRHFFDLTSLLIPTKFAHI